MGNDVRKAADEVTKSVFRQYPYFDKMESAEIIAKHCVGKDKVREWIDRFEIAYDGYDDYGEIHRLIAGMREACGEEGEA